MTGCASLELNSLDAFMEVLRPSFEIHTKIKGSFTFHICVMNVIETFMTQAFFLCGRQAIIEMNVMK